LDTITKGEKGHLPAERRGKNILTEHNDFQQTKKGSSRLEGEGTRRERGEFKEKKSGEVLETGRCTAMGPGGRSVAGRKKESHRI